jgi:hypothetical protein
LLRAYLYSSRPILRKHIDGMGTAHSTSVFDRTKGAVGPKGSETDESIARDARQFALRHGLRDGDVLNVRNAETGISYDLEVFRETRGRPWHIHDDRGSAWSGAWGRTVALHRLQVSYLTWRVVNNTHQEGGFSPPERIALEA